MNLNSDELEAAHLRLLLATAHLQARHDALECLLQAIIQNAPDAHPLLLRSLHTAQSHLQDRWANARAEIPPHVEASALQLLNTLRAACSSSPPDQPAGA